MEHIGCGARRANLTRSHVAGYMLRTSKRSLANGTLVVASHGEERDEEENDGELIGRVI